MKKEKVGRIIVFIICLLIIILTFYADKFIFFDGQLKPLEYAYKKTNNTKEKKVATSFWFDYGEEREVQYGADNIQFYIIKLERKLR